jgi:segregation and condensation protein B
VSNESERLVEASLFIAGQKAITVKEIEESVGLDPRTIRAALDKLQEQYASDDTAIEIIKMGAKYCMQVKGKYGQKMGNLEEPDMPKDVQKVASLIACYQPILQSKLAELVGPLVYDGVKILSERGLVNVKPKGRSFELTTTQKFIEYFGLDARSREDVKRIFEKKTQAVPNKD